MLSFLALVNDLNEVHAKLSSRFEDENQLDPELNPVALRDRLKALQTQMAELKPKIDELQAAREELVEALFSAKSLETITQKLPEVAEQAATAERSLNAARVAAKGANAFSRTGKEGSKRSTRIEREARLANAMNASNRANTETSPLIISQTMYDSLQETVRGKASLSDIQSSASVLLRCGGILSQNSVSKEIGEALVQLGVATVNNTSQELCLARQHGVLLL